MSKKVHYTVTINGKKFEANANEHLCRIPQLSGATRLEEVYGRFSSAKEYVWNEWHDFYSDISNYKCSFEISSHNCNVFMLSMVVYDESNNQYWYLHITPSHNYAIKITEKE